MKRDVNIVPTMPFQAVSKANSKPMRIDSGIRLQSIPLTRSPLVAAPFVSFAFLNSLVWLLVPRRRARLLALFAWLVLGTKA